jgi:hypothetical protein
MIGTKTRPFFSQCCGLIALIIAGIAMPPVSSSCLVSPRFGNPAGQDAVLCRRDRSHARVLLRKILNRGGEALFDQSHSRAMLNARLTGDVAAMSFW